MKDHVGAILRPTPHASCGHLCAAVVGRADLTLSSGVVAGQPFETLCSLHGTLELFRAAVIDLHRLAQNVDAVLIAVQFVILPGGEAIREHSVRVDLVKCAEQRVL